MIDCNCGKYTLELMYNCKINTVSNSNETFSNVYTQMIDISRNAPVYLIYPTDKLQNFALQIKDISTQLAAMITSFFLAGSENPLNQYKLISDSSEYVTVKSIKQPSVPVEYALYIHNVAVGQINTSAQVSSRTCPFTAQTYSFTITANNQIYDFEIPVTNRSSNYEVLSKISNSINNSTAGLEAQLVEKDSYLTLHIKALPHRRNEPATFTIKDTSPNGIIAFYNLGTISNLPQPSDFTINDTAYHSYGTAFEIDGLFELCLLKPCSTPIQIGFVMDDTKISSEISQLQDTINSLISLAKSCSKKKLAQELSSFLHSYSSQLESIGIRIDDLDQLYSDHNQLNNSIKDESIRTVFSEDTDFTTELLEQVHEISINPMQYLPNKIVSYKDFRKIHFPNPYVTSIYSGFLFTNYC